MRYVRPLVVGAVTVAALFAAAAPASAWISPITTASGQCPTGYKEVARVGNTVVCYDVNVPRTRLITDGSDCPAGYTEYSVLDHYRLCVD